MAALGLHCCVQAFSSCGEWGLLFIVVRGLLFAVASLVVEHRLYGTQASVVVARRLSCSAACGIFPALTGRFSTTAPPGKPLFFFLKILFSSVLDDISHKNSFHLFRIYYVSGTLCHCVSFNPPANL